MNPRDRALDALLWPLDPRRSPPEAAAALLDAWLLTLLPDPNNPPPSSTRADALLALSHNLDPALHLDLLATLPLTDAPPWAPTPSDWPPRRARLLQALAARLPDLPQPLLDHWSTSANTAPIATEPLAQTGRHEPLPRPARAAPTEAPAPRLPPRPLMLWLVHALREAGRPMTPYELREAALRDGHDGLDRAEDDAVAQIREVLARSGAVLRVDLDTWQHRDALAISARHLDEIVTWSLDFLEGHARPVHLRALWKELEQANRLRAGLTPWLLRDALARSSDAVTFHNEQLLAHVESYEEDGHTLLDRLEALLRPEPSPLSLPDLRARLPLGVHFHARALYGLLLGAPWCLRLSDERFCHINALGDGVDRWSKDAAEALALIDPARPARCDALVEALRARHPNHPLWSRDDAAPLLWGLLLKHPAAQCGADARAAHHHSDGALQLLTEAILEALERLEPAPEPRLLQAVTRRYGYRGPQVFRDALLRAQSRGLIDRAGDTWARAQP
jgi:hypothetical protein